MSKLRAAYHEMYLVTKNVYLKVLDCIDETSRRAMEELNRSDDNDPEERRPSEDFFDDLTQQDIEEGVQPQSIPIQEREQYVQEHGRQRVHYPMLTYEPDLPPIRDTLRRSYGRFEEVGPIPTLRHSTLPKLLYLPSTSAMEKQSEVIKRPQAVLPPPRPNVALPPPRPIRRHEESQYDESSYSPRTPRHSESSSSERMSTPILKTQVRQRPPVRVSYYDEGMETIQDCARGVTGSICRSETGEKVKRAAGFQCDICNKILSTRHSLNRHLKIHKSPGRFAQGSEPLPSTSTASFTEWDTPVSTMETSALPGRGERKRGFDEYETDEDVPIAKHYAVRAARKKKQVESEQEGSGKKDTFETWQ